MLRKRRQSSGVTARHASVAVIGAGDFIGGAIAERFAAEGYRVFGGRRNGDQLAPLKAKIEAAGGRFEGRVARRPREEDQVTAFMAEADADAAAGGVHLQRRRQRQLPDPGDHRAGVPQGLGDGLLRRLPHRPRGGAADAGARRRARSSSPARPPRCAAASATPPSPAPSSACARWPSRWRASWGRRNIHVAHLIIDAGVDTAFVRERIAAARRRGGAGAARSPTPLMDPALDRRGLLDAAQPDAATPGPSNSTCGPIAETW